MTITEIEIIEKVYTTGIYDVYIVSTNYNIDGLTACYILYNNHTACYEQLFTVLPAAVKAANIYTELLEAQAAEAGEFDNESEGEDDDKVVQFSSSNPTKH